MENNNKIRVGIIGATGYAGAELVRLLLSHPNAELAAISSVSFEGKSIAEVYPGFKEICGLTLTDMDSVINASDVVFASLPAGLSEEIAVKTTARGIVLIDLGADFRLDSSEEYKQWYGGEYKDAGLHKKAVYALPELFRDKIYNADIIGNPGCYPTSVALGIAPALRSGLISTEGIIIDSKSGVTGAGRGLTQNTHYPDANENFAAYKAGVHRHTPEIEQTLSLIAGKKLRVTFVPHLLPVNRGIESTIYCKLNTPVKLGEIHDIYTEFYKNERFVRIEPLGSYANIKNVRCSNYCDISLHADERTGTLIISSCIDNMFKGAAGQAIQNMNLRFGFDEAAGIGYAPVVF